MFCWAVFDQWRTTIMHHLSHLSKPQATVLAVKSKMCCKIAFRTPDTFSASLSESRASQRRLRGLPLKVLRHVEIPLACTPELMLFY